MVRKVFRALSLGASAMVLTTMHAWAEPATNSPTLASAEAAADAPRDPEYVADYVVDKPAEEPAPKQGLWPDALQGAASDNLSPGEGAEQEVIKERFPNGSVKIERQVTQDAEGNYINHGSWMMWDERGNVVAQGQFDHDQREGTWQRWYRSVNEAGLLSKQPYQQFSGPFLSRATFKRGQLDGHWTIYDRQNRKVSEWQFADGKRHGKSTWWHANGRKMREATFIDGTLDGQLQEWSAEGVLRLNDTFQAGRKLAKRLKQYPDGKKKSEAVYLFAKEVVQTPDDWWNCKLLVTAPAGSDEKHGPFVSWHPNGQRQLEGAYEHGLQVGTFTWWRPNGQQQLQGSFVAGKQHGVWTWWYGNGQKQIQGEYANGNPTGKWSWWREDGKVARAADLTGGEGVVLDEPRTLGPPQAPRLSRPAPLPSRPVLR